MGGRENSSLEQQNKELRISKNMLIDKVELQDKALRERDEHITSMENELQELQGQLARQEKVQKKADQKERRKRIRNGINRFLDRVEAALYRLWLGLWVVIVGLALSVTATIILNGELRESIFGFFNSYLFGH